MEPTRYLASRELFLPSGSEKMHQPKKTPRSWMDGYDDHKRKQCKPLQVKDGHIQESLLLMPKMLRGRDFDRDDLPNLLDFWSSSLYFDLCILLWAKVSDGE
jgi:hypothetical protein